MAGLVLNRSRQAPAEDTPAFGGIAERFRRAGDLERAIALCREGLRKFPGQLSARVTLGWALLDTGEYEEAREELEQVLRRAPDNLAAIRGLAELHDRTENSLSSMDAASSWNRNHEEASRPQAHLAETVPPDAPAAVSEFERAAFRPQPVLLAREAVDGGIPPELVGGWRAPAVPPVAPVFAAPAVVPDTPQPFSAAFAKDVAPEPAAPQVVVPFEIDPLPEPAALPMPAPARVAPPVVAPELLVARAAERSVAPSVEIAGANAAPLAHVAEPPSPVAHELVQSLAPREPAGPVNLVDLGAPAAMDLGEAGDVLFELPTSGAASLDTEFGEFEHSFMRSDAAPAALHGAPFDVPTVSLQAHGDDVLGDGGFDVAMLPAADAGVEVPAPWSSPAAEPASVALFSPVERVSAAPRPVAPPSPIAALERFLRKIEARRLELTSASVA